MTKIYENQSPYSNPELIRRIGVLGDMWVPGMSDLLVNELYKAVMNPNTPEIVIEYLQAGIILEKSDPDSPQHQLSRNQI